MCVGVPVVVLHSHVTISVNNLGIYFRSFARLEDPSLWYF